MSNTICCSLCERALPLEAFTPSQRRPGCWCRECRASRRKAGPLVRQPRPCAECGATTDGNGKRRYCSPACSARASYRRKHPDAKRQTPARISTCAWCANPFKATKDRKRFCSRACTFAHRSHYRSGQSTPLTYANCLHCQATFISRRNAQMCSDRCRKRWAGNKQGNIAWGADRQGQCSCCGQPFVYPSATRPRLYCSEACSDIERRRSEKAKRPDVKRLRRARKRAVAYETIKAIDIFERDDWRCGICGQRTLKTKQVPHPRAPTLDHVLPLAQGGSHTKANVQCACFICNARKGDRPSTRGDQLRLVG